MDFSRIKPWYLDGQYVSPRLILPLEGVTHVLDSAAFLRQTILLSAYETPEIRSLFNQSLLNVAGKVRSERRWSPIAVPDGIDQVSSRRYYQRCLDSSSLFLVIFSVRLCQSTG